MILFAALALCLTVLALLPVVLALRRHRTSEHEDQRLRAYRARLAEIESETRDGVIAADQADSARREIEREMLQHVGSHAQDAGMQAPQRATTAVVIALFVSIAALGLYLFGGRPDLIGVDTRAEGHPDVEAMIQKVVAHLEQSPEDRGGWEMLCRSYMALQRYPEAVDAFEHLYVLTGDEPDVLVGYADALAMAGGGKLSGQPTELINKALVLEPQHRTALWLAGMAAMERGESESAVAYWQTLIPLLEDENSRVEVARLIEQAGGSPAAAGAAAASGITVKVEIAPALAADIPADATVFITARAPDGPPMPLAVIKRSAKELPFEVVLDDTLAMSPQHRLSQHDMVDLTARISRSGRAERESGDWIAELRAVPVDGAATRTLTINAQVP